FGFSPDLYLPASRETDVVALIARLPEGMSLSAAHERLSLACKELDKVYPPEWNPQASWVMNTDVVPVAGMARLRHLSMVPFVAFFSMLLIVKNATNGTMLRCLRRGAVRGVLLDAVDRGRSRPADRLRQRLEPAAGPSVGPPAGAGDPAGPRRRASPHRAPAAGREPAPGSPGRRGRTPAHPMDGRHPQPRAVAAADTRASADTTGLAPALVLGGDRPRERPRRRSAARSEGDPRRRQRGPETDRTSGGRPLEPARRADRDAARGVGRALDDGRPLRQEHDQV